MSFLFYVMGLTSFWASTISMILTAGFMYFFRRDLLKNGILAGILMVLVSILAYGLIILISPEWLDTTYLFESLSGIKIYGIPVEEFVFWFLAGLIFGPFYEYWQGERLRKIAK